MFARTRHVVSSPSRNRFYGSWRSAELLRKGRFAAKRPEGMVLEPRQERDRLFNSRFAARRPDGIVLVPREACEPKMQESVNENEGAAKLGATKQEATQQGATQQEATKQGEMKPGLKKQRPNVADRILGTIYARPPRQLTSAEIVERLPSVHVMAHSRFIDSVLLMVTPSLAHLVDDQEFQYLALNKIFKAIRSHNFQVTCTIGVVDKVAGLGTSGHLFNESCEGIAYMYTPATSIRWQPRSSANDKALLRLTCDINSGPIDLSAGDEHVQRGTGSVTIPLTNTLFINGHVATLKTLVWARDNQSAAKDFYPNGTPRDSGVVNLKYYPDSARSLHPALIPLTEWRPIKSALGNVVREVEVGVQTVPASTELEAAVEMARRSMPAGSSGTPFSNVFAVLRPGHHRSWSLTDAGLWTGCRVHKVTGGGGGWGSRAGMLSLDPAISFPELDEPKEAAAQDDQVGEFPSLENFGREGNLVKDGDSIAFFHDTGRGEFCTSSDQSELDAQWHESLSGPPSSLIKLGTIPRDLVFPDTDSASASPAATGDNNSPDSQGITHAEGRFGLLTEEGLAIEYNGYEVERKEVEPSIPSTGKIRSTPNSRRMNYKTLLQAPDASFTLDVAKPSALGNVRLDLGFTYKQRQGLAALNLRRGDAAIAKQGVVRARD